MGGSSGPLQQSRQVFGAADLHHLLHRLKIHAQIQGAGAHHPADGPGFDGRFDRFTLMPVDGAVMERQGVLHFRTGKSEALVPTFGLIAGVGEQQRADAGIELGHQLLVHAQSQMACPGEAIDVVRQDAGDVCEPFGRFANNHRRPNVPQGVACRLVKIADGGTDRPGLELWSQLTQPAQAEFRLAAAFAAHQLVPFVEDDGVQSFEQRLRLAIADQQREGFRRGDQDLRRRLQLLGALTAAAVAISDADTQRPPHRLDRFANGQSQVTAQGPQGCDVNQLDACAWGGFAQHPGDRSHHRSKGFAGSGGHLNQSAVARKKGIPGPLLKRQRGPSLPLEPFMDGR